MKRIIILTIAILLLFIRVSHSEPTPEIDKNLSDLEPKIGSFPPQISSELERELIEKKYLHVKQLLDEELTRHPDQTDLLYKRGFLQSMGNNLGYPTAFEGSDEDLRAVLKSKPDHKEALVALGNLYVNTHQTLVNKSEALFLAAQEVQGKEPLEGAQQGLFYVYYYQGNMEKALEKARLLTKTWPKVEKYVTLERIAKAAIARRSRVNSR